MKIYENIYDYVLFKNDETKENDDGFLQDYKDIKEAFRTLNDIDQKPIVKVNSGVLDGVFLLEAVRK